jgi:hypothetical protein
LCELTCGVGPVALLSSQAIRQKQSRVYLLLVCAGPGAGAAPIGTYNHKQSVRKKTHKSQATADCDGTYVCEHAGQSLTLPAAARPGRQAARQRQGRRAARQPGGQPGPAHTHASLPGGERVAIRADVCWLITLLATTRLRCSLREVRLSAWRCSHPQRWVRAPL